MQSNLEHITLSKGENNSKGIWSHLSKKWMPICPQNGTFLVHSQSPILWYFFVHVLENSHYERYVLKLSDLYRSVNWVAKSDPE